jgi:hypothetical protein
MTPHKELKFGVDARDRMLRTVSIMRQMDMTILPTR